MGQNRDKNINLNKSLLAILFFICLIPFSNSFATNYIFSTPNYNSWSSPSNQYPCSGSNQTGIITYCNIPIINSNQTTNNRIVLSYLNSGNTSYWLLNNTIINSGFGYLYNGNIYASGTTTEVGAYIGTATSNNGGIAKAAHFTAVDNSQQGSIVINGITGQVIANPNTKTSWAVDAEDYGQMGKTILFHGGSLNGAWIGLNLGDSKFTDSAIVLQSNSDQKTSKIRWTDGAYLWEDGNSTFHFGNGIYGETMKLDKQGNLWIRGTFNHN